MDKTSHVGIFHSFEHIRHTHVACPWQHRQLTYKPFLLIVSAANALNQWAFLSSNMSVKSIGSAFQMSSESIDLFISLLLPLSSFPGSVTWLSCSTLVFSPPSCSQQNPFFKELLKWTFVVIVVQLLSYVWLFVTPWTAACQAPLSFTIFWSLFRFMSLSWWCYLTISSSVTSFSSCHQSFLASRSFPMSRIFASGGQSIGASASVSVFPVNIQD